MKHYIRTLALLVLTASFCFGQDNLTYQRPPEEIAKLLEAPLTPSIGVSPDHTWMMLLERSDYPSIEELSRPELRIAGMRINPDNFGPSRAAYFVGVKAKKIADNKDFEIKGLPENLLASNFSFSPDSKKAAFLNSLPDKIELWVVDLSTLTASKISERKISNVMGGAFDWLSDSEHLVFSAVPANAGKLPERTRVPKGPIVEENLGKKAPSRTYQDLLSDPHDEALFEHYGTSELVLKKLGGTEKVIGKPAMYFTVTPSPDAKYILTRAIHKPFSYLVPYYRFPQLVQVLDLDGAVVSKVYDAPLADNIPSGFNAVQTGPRNHSWRNDKPATLYWVEAQDGGDPKTEAEIRDKVFAQEAPFSGDAKEIASTSLRYSGIDWGDDQTAFVYEYWWANRKLKVQLLNPTTGKSRVMMEYSTQDAYNDPGNVVSTNNKFGRSVMLLDNGSVYMTGRGSSPQGDMPFLDKMELATGKKTRLWRCEAPYYERVVSLLDAKKLSFITSRESNQQTPNYYLRTSKGKKLTQLTEFPHPYLQIKDVTKQVLKYKRADGVELTADLYLPPGYKKEDGPLPTFLWAYPREFKSKDNASQVTGSPYTFTRIGWGSAIYWVVRGYAILDNAAIPIVGEGDKEPNDTYIEQLVSSAKAAIDYGASLGYVDPKRVAAGGHSYGAFMTANLLAHSDLFKAGIARSGAYNRTLTPFGFQAEQRTYWEAPEVYFNMSPFSFADKIDEPLLLTHGTADNNSGTFPIQSERLYNAIKGHGGTARYVQLPYESHGYRAKESILHMLWEMDNWLETYVKKADVSAKADK